MGAMSIGKVGGVAGIGSVDRGLVGTVGSEDGWGLVGKVELRNGLEWVGMTARGCVLGGRVVADQSLLFSSLGCVLAGLRCSSSFGCESEIGKVVACQTPPCCVFS